MSTKKARVNDLAKEAGITGKELLEKLHSWGFNDIKSAQSALEFDMELRVRGLMEARGVMKVGGAAPEAASAVGELGGLIKKKKKKLSLDGGADDGPSEGDAPAATQPAPAVEVPAAPVVEAPPKPVTQAVEPEPEPRAPVEVAKPAAHVEPEPALEPDEPRPVAASVDQAVEAAPVAEERIVRPAATEVAPAAQAASAPAQVQPAPAQVAPVAASAAAPAPAVAPQGAAPASSEPKAAPRAGKVVGFVDLSKFKPQTPAKKPTESRRLRGKDEVTPDVKPTMPHDKKRALGRGTPVARGQMSASQLRTQASDRFLRRNQIAAQGAERTARGGGGGRQAGRGDSSPFSGQKVEIDAPVTVKKLADKLAIKSNELLKVAFGQMGFGAVNINSLLDEDTAVLLAGEFEVELVVVQEVEAETELLGEIKQKRTAIAGDDLAARAPTVAILGHVDHGKTTLIDAIRNSNVASGEAGGITQHIGAYSVQTKAGHQLTIIDTPGHSAFTQMRARGAKAVDIVVLVVAADDGPMPSTEEALAHARAAKVPVVVALTKTDKPEANLQRTKESLTKLGLVPEEWGGETAMMGVSALKNEGVDELLERVLVV
ncbi:MAG: translation initiation factor [Planctomycetota bacterium]